MKAVYTFRSEHNPCMNLMNSDVVVSDCILIPLEIWTCKALFNTLDISCITATKGAVTMFINTQCVLAFGEARSSYENTRASGH